MSMRSDETVNVGAVAAMFSGGGHVCAAGCGLAAKTQKKLEAETDRLRLGRSYDTGDVWGNVIAELTPEQERRLAALTGGNLKSRINLS